MKRVFFFLKLILVGIPCICADWTTVNDRTTGFTKTGSLKWATVNPIDGEGDKYFYKDAFLPFSFIDYQSAISITSPYNETNSYGVYPAGGFYIIAFPSQAEREKYIQDKLFNGNDPSALAIFDQASPGSVSRYCSQYTGSSSTYTYVRGKGKPSKTNIPYDVRKYCQIMGPESDPCEENPQDCRITDYYKTPKEIWEHRFIIPKFPPEFFQPKGYCPKNAYFLIHMRLLRFKDPEFLTMEKKTQQDLEEENKKILESFKSLKWHFPD